MASLKELTCSKQDTEKKIRQFKKRKEEVAAILRDLSAISENFQTDVNHKLKKCSSAFQRGIGEKYEIGIALDFLRQKDVCDDPDLSACDQDLKREAREIDEKLDELEKEVRRLEFSIEDAEKEEYS